ncbi:MAG: hypothetical protein ACJ8G1_24735, partial [Vitreoscilla sp.]
MAAVAGCGDGQHSEAARSPVVGQSLEVVARRIGVLIDWGLVDGLDVDCFAAGQGCACDRVGRGSALRLAVRLDPAWTAGSTGFRSFDWLRAL